MTDGKAETYNNNNGEIEKTDISFLNLDSDSHLKLFLFCTANNMNHYEAISFIITEYFKSFKSRPVYSQTIDLDTLKIKEKKPSNIKKLW